MFIYKKDHVEEEEIIEGGEEEEESQDIIDNEDTNMVSARPRRMSEVKDEPQPIIPIPEGSAFFFLSQTNRCALYKLDEIHLIDVPITFTLDNVSA